VQGELPFFEVPTLVEECLQTGMSLFHCTELLIHSVRLHSRSANCCVVLIMSDVLSHTEFNPRIKDRPESGRALKKHARRFKVPEAGPGTGHASLQSKQFLQKLAASSDGPSIQPPSEHWPFPFVYQKLISSPSILF
jgi:hypothetical protein